MNDIELARAVAINVRTEWLQRHAYINPLQVMVLPIRDLIHELGIEIAEKSARDMKSTLAYLDLEEPLIWMRQYLPSTLQTFTLAHELGHWFLHRGSNQREPCEIDEFRDVLGLQSLEAYSPRSLKEQQADAFAIELLAPLPLVANAMQPSSAIPPMTLYQFAERVGLAPRHMFMQVVRLLQGEVPSSPGEMKDDRHSIPQLDADQLSAAHANAPAIIVAGPGSGKTSTLVERVRWLIAQGQPSQTILALTFSRKAAAEMYERILTTLRLAPQEMPTITTFHRFGAEILRRYGHAIDIPPSFQLYDEIASFLLLQTCVPALELEVLRSLRAPTQYYSLFLDAISRAKDELLQPMDIFLLADEIASSLECTEQNALEAAKLRDIARVYDAYSLALFENHGADFGDLIMQTTRLFEEKPEILHLAQKQYQTILVDEFQDINKANTYLLNLLAGEHHQIWAVGDAFQSIYGFRGASRESMRQFRQDYPDAQMIVLSKTYRSQQNIVDAANSFARAYFTDEVEGQPVANLQTVRSECNGSVSIIECATGVHEMSTIARDIQARFANGTAPEHCAVLCRTNTAAQEMAAQLRQFGIPAEIATDVFDDERIRALLGFAGVLAGEYGGLLALTHLPECPLPRELALQMLDAIRSDMALADAWKLVSAGARPAEAQLMRTIQSILDTLARESAAGIFPAMMRLVFAELAIGNQALKQHDEFSLHLIELFNLLQRFDAHFSMPLHIPDEQQARYRWHACMNFLRMLTGLKRAEGQSSGHTQGVVQVLTAHGAKGLEWPIVYVPLLAQTKFPSTYRRRPFPVLHKVSPNHAEEEKQAHQREESHLFYVAMTRARDTLVLTHAKKYGKTARKPSEYLDILAAMDSVEQIEMAEMDDEQVDSNWIAEADLSIEAGAVLSAGAIATYARCPRQFAYSNVYQLRNQNNGFLRMRNTVFKTLQATLRDGELAVADRFDVAWEAELTMGTGEFVENLDAYYHREGVKLAEHMHAGLQRIYESQSARYEFGQILDLPLEHEVVRVQVDRLVYSKDNPKGPQVFRHQLDRQAARKEPDITDYFYLLAQQSLQNDGDLTAISDYLAPLNREVPVELSARRQQTFRQKALAAIAGIRAGIFTADPEEEQCQRCPFILHCPY